MMRRLVRIALSAAVLAAFTLSCTRVEVLEEPDRPYADLPEGAPATLQISFGSAEMVQLSVGTKAEASDVDESRVHDLYVMIFDNATLVDGSPKKIYGRYFGSPANIRGSLSEESTQPEHEEGQVGYASELSTEAFDFGVERFG